MTKTRRLSARTILLAAGAAGFVALGSGVAGAEGLQAPLNDVVSPLAEQALVKGVAPTVNKIAPEGVTPIAGATLEELQASANDPGRGAPDLGAALPDSPLANTLSETRSATGMDGNPHDTIGHTAGAALESTAQDAGASLESTAKGAGDRFEQSANEVLPHTVVAVAELRDEVLTLPEAGDLRLPSTDSVRLPELSEAPSLTEVTDLGSVTDLTGGNSLELPVEGSTERMSHTEGSIPTAPNVWDLAAGFGVETPKRIQDVVESTELTQDNYVSLGEEEVLGMVGNRAWDDAPAVVPQSSPEAPALTDLTGAVVDGVSSNGLSDSVSLNGPLADNELPQVAEGVDTTTVEDLVAGLSRGTDLLNDIDTSDLVSIEGGTVEPETPEGMTQHPTFMDLPGSEALPVIS
ncbi:hypothetical protein ACFYOC_15515 [Nocardiopsis alba]|uniref:hypothetical protein n=1 Tax=Nocardiopsis alba TaxID=53437 RepID=UPI0036A30516